MNAITTVMDATFFSTTCNIFVCIRYVLTNGKDMLYFIFISHHYRWIFADQLWFKTTIQFDYQD